MCFFTYKINTVFVTLNETIDVNELREVGLYSSKGILKILDILVKLRMSLISVGYRGGGGFPQCTETGHFEVQNGKKFWRGGI